ncbi:PREDICTED: P17/29C-like protein DDB_G0287399, partial [Rhagoletis zephyria]|uniref:P17/29C-like protein DDB_G0287399 n=1 Tax=Rhagoletis zephyria TaxID=28612 RepID=UPI00081185CB
MIMLLRYIHLLATTTTALTTTLILLACIGGGGGNSGSFATAATNSQNGNTRNYSRSGRDNGGNGNGSGISSGSSTSAVFRALVSAAATNSISMQSDASLASDSSTVLISGPSSASSASSASSSFVSSPFTSASLTAANLLLTQSHQLSGISEAAATSSAAALLTSASLTGSSGLGGGSGGSSTSSGSSSSGRSSRQNVGTGGITNNNVNGHGHGIQVDQLPAQLSSRIIHTRNGAISGVIVQLEGRHLDPVEAYRGIPYASPPVGNLRFMPPVSAAMWSGVKKADRFSPVCPQRLPDIGNETAALERMPKGRLEYLKRLLPYLQNQSEDCLYLNIYVPIQ